MSLQGLYLYVFLMILCQTFKNIITQLAIRMLFKCKNKTFLLAFIYTSQVKV